MINFPPSIKNILVTGGGGFIGGSLVRRLLIDTNLNVINVDKLGYSSDLTGINKTLISSSNIANRYKFFKADLSDFENTKRIIHIIDPDIIFHLAAETHVDRSINDPANFLTSNVISTFNLIEASRIFWEKLPETRKRIFRFHNVSTDEVFGSLGVKNKFSETSSYAPRNPYSASKACCDHFVSAWYQTYGLPISISNCSNNYGPWQFPDKLIPMTIFNALNGETIPLYGQGLNIRDWLFVEDHVDALILIAIQGKAGSQYCIGGSGEKNNLNVINTICKTIDSINPKSSPHNKLIREVKDRLGHDFRYSIDYELINKELGWKPNYNFEEGLDITIKWYVDNIDWCNSMRKRLTK